MLREAITCGALVPGDDLPSVSELARLQGLKVGTIQHAFLVLAEEGLRTRAEQDEVLRRDGWDRRPDDPPASAEATPPG